ncbi:hypothetical protein NDU88_001303 [Pleurodeles waltl]|uniref:Uncharacterized protein n=1 Tax=Pleurodeles waltl TaxID=8319 RepID=A0AAV7SZM4_PLEWA|nr:hypothetical protein NDU88_001303 [Pleurodeles waltl]
MGLTSGRHAQLSGDGPEETLAAQAPGCWWWRGFGVSSRAGGGQGAHWLGQAECWEADAELRRQPCRHWMRHTKDFDR